MVKSLKERRNDRKFRLLHERLQVIDEQLMREHRVANLLIEAMSEDDLNKVTAIVQKLNTVKNPQLPTMSRAIEQAQAEINKYTAGGPLTKAWSKIKGLVGVDNPIVKVTTFASALERGFSQVPAILKNNGVDLQGADTSKSLFDVVGAGEGAEKKLRSITDQLRKALSPSGIYGTFKKVPYIDSQALSQELIKVPISVFSQIAKKIQTGAKAADIATDLKAQITGQGEDQTKNGNRTQPTEPSNQTQPGEPSKQTTVTTKTTPTGEHPAQPLGTKRGGGGTVANHKQKAFNQLKDNDVFKKVGLNDASAEAFLDALDDIGALKNPE
jgi:hypothetical protein